MDNTLYQFPRGNRKQLSEMPLTQWWNLQQYFLLKDLSESHSYIAGNKYSLLSWRTNPIIYFYKIERINKNG
jgi:hypothetical protein